MTTATLNPQTEPRTATSEAAPAIQSGTTTTSTRKTAVLVGLLFLTATFTFAIGNSLIHSHFPSASSHNGMLVVGVFLLCCHGLADATNGLAMRRILTPHTPIRSQTYLVLRAAECLTVGAIGVYLLTSQTLWDAYVLPVYVLSGAAGLVLSSALLTSRLVQRN